MGSSIIILSIVFGYFLLTVWIGFWGYKRTKMSSIEDYVMGGRQFGTLVLLMAVFATNMSAFIFVGMPGAAYHLGIGIFGWGIVFCVGLPIFIRFLLYPGWLLGKRYGYITMNEICGDRYESEAVNITMFALLMFYTIPYLLIGIIGAGLSFYSMTQGVIPYWLGGLLVTVIIFAYTYFGGMRGAAWNNVLQAFIFIIAAIVALVLIAQGIGGMETATQNVLATKPKLLQRAGFPPFTYKNWFSFMLIIQAAAAFPHVWLKALTGKSHKTLQKMAVLYPIAGVVFWLPCIVVGVWGAAQIPGLVGAASDSIFPMMVAKYTGAAVTGLLLAGIFAAIMSTQDAMIMTTSIMFSKDILARYMPKHFQGKEVLTTRAFIAGISIITYLLALSKPAAILSIAEYAFSGYVLILPVMFATLYWKRSTKYGVIASLITGAVTLLLLQFKILPLSLRFGFMPIVPSMVVSIVVLIVVSITTRPPSQQTIDKFLGFLKANIRYND